MAEIDKSILEGGALGLALLVIYSLVDKLVLPLVRGKNGNGELRQLERRIEQRLDSHDREIREIVAALAAITRTVDLSQAILERVEENLKD
jgi:hypothetical protein